MHILVTNDDGIHHPGLAALRDGLARDHRVQVVAPDRERSAIAHAITLLTPLRAFSQTNGNGIPSWAVNGTPADCVKLGVLELLGEKPDLVVSGINPGPNVGVNLNYSGTVSAAREAALLGIPAIAVSVSNPYGTHFSDAARFMQDLVADVAERGLPKGVFLNVNLPDAPMEEIAGVRICRQGIARLEEAFHVRRDPRDQPYYWQGSETQLFGESPDEDGVALRENCIAVTPVQCDMTDYGFLSRLKEWKVEKP
ncbi:5'-nucleotidase /3'-nucleotidase /exopolyphosphatase [Desulfatibacillum alkenivorans DSM 16219]|uniref:5'-nucleotidase SurE n=1 Tax=Desulfatibacillum alkenivorans DSM 16219 TaxID=1121393 RepID=A0A1M6FHG6_9BACT|nr:5'/3'-nucleotidase SurE [Desulfatibacillum alkenivorans]SHI97117.1 5'-nucleotidase /3'-nucleotidase /exopolyphosphatase [Desulfatibacillum alkenivorans DSM 16219]